jgi:multicomponent Na+:H+ antiporter subunit E
MRPLPKGADGNIFRSASISKANYQNVRGGQLSAGSVLRAVLLFAALFGFWLAMSGHYKWWLVMLGAMIAFGLTFWAMWLDLADKEGFPVHMGLRAIIYWPWLMLEIITSALDVTRRIILLEKGIAPAMKRVRAGQKTPEGLTTFANSITLTPGTISVLVDWKDHDVVVHGLVKENLDDLEGGEMDRRVRWFEGST